MTIEDEILIKTNNRNVFFILSWISPYIRIGSIMLRREWKIDVGENFSETEALFYKELGKRLSIT